MARVDSNYQEQLQELEAENQYLRDNFQELQAQFEVGLEILADEF
jgi:prefoldin subunit 5